MSFSQSVIYMSAIYIPQFHESKLILSTRCTEGMKAAILVKVTLDSPKLKLAFHVGSI